MAAEQIEHEAVIPLAEETLTVSKRKIERRRLRVQLKTAVDTQLAQASLRREDIVVDRVPMNKVITAAPDVREEDGVTIIPVFEEIVVVSKQLVLREELHIRRVVTTRESSEPVELRRQYATTEFLESSASTMKDTDNG